MRGLIPLRHRRGACDMLFRLILAVSLTRPDRHLGQDHRHGPRCSSRRRRREWATVPFSRLRVSVFSFNWLHPCDGRPIAEAERKPWTVISAFHALADELQYRGDISGSILAGTPIAAKPAGTLVITREFAAIIAPSPMVTAPMMLEWHPMYT